MTVPPGVMQPTTPETRPCAACAAPLADGQRYCLQCGERASGERRRLPALLRRGHRPEASIAAAAPATAERWTSPAALLAGVACLLLAMGVGVLIGHAAGEGAAAPAPITIAGGPTAPPAALATATFTSDWPAGKRGWTIALEMLPKASTPPDAVAAAKANAASRGAAAAGALDSDAYPSLTAGSYVIYSGIFDTSKAAAGALASSKAKFADARVVRIGPSGSTPAAPPAGSSKATSAKKKGASKSAGADTSKEFEKSKKAPKTVGTGGKPPPVDHKPAAAGGGFEDIG